MTYTDGSFCVCNKFILGTRSSTNCFYFFPATAALNTELALKDG